MKKEMLSTVVLAVMLFCSTTMAGSKVGDKAPDFTATTVEGRKVNLSDYVGKKAVYLKFWATWCTYCKAEFPHFEATYNKYGHKVEVLSINVGINDSISNIEKLYAKEGYTVPVILDTDGSIVSSYNVVGTPSAVLIGKDGNIEYRTFHITDELNRRITSF